MSRVVSTQGYFSPAGAKPVPCTLRLSLDGNGLHENLTVDIVGAYRITTPFRPIERLVRQARQQAGGNGGTLELAARLEGSDESLRTVELSAWIRLSGGFEMLTLEQGRRGQVSLPYEVVQTLVRKERSTQV